MISINLTLFIQMANVLVLLFLMNLVLFRPIRRIVAQRNQFLAEQQERIDRADAQVQAAVADFNAGILDARKLGRHKIQDLKAAAYEQEKGLLSEATELAGKQVQDMRVTIQGEMQDARKQLKKQVKAFSVDLAQKILGRTL